MEADPNVPDWARGRTARELLEIGETWRQAATNNQYQQQPPQQAAFSYQQPIQQQGVQPPDPALMYSDPAQYQNQMLAYNQHAFQQQMNAAAQPLVSGVVDMARFASQQQDKKTWDRWGHEIEREVSQLPMQMRNKQAFDLALQIVKGRHVDEIANERALELQANGGPGFERGGAVGAAPSMASDPLSELWNDDTNGWVQEMKRAQATPQSIRDYCAKTGTDVNAYVADIKKGNVFTSGSAA